MHFILPLSMIFIFFYLLNFGFILIFSIPYFAVLDPFAFFLIMKYYFGGVQLHYGYCLLVKTYYLKKGV